MEQVSQNTNTTKATWGIALRVWWWVMWRSVLVGLVGGFIIGFIIGFVLGFIGVNTDSNLTQIISGLISFFFGFGVYLFFFKKIFGREFKGFTVVLLKTEQ